MSDVASLLPLIKATLSSSNPDACNVASSDRLYQRVKRQATASFGSRDIGEDYRRRLELTISAVSLNNWTKKLLKKQQTVCERQAGITGNAYV